jgi:hypothetical protein
MVWLQWLNRSNERKVSMRTAQRVAYQLPRARCRPLSTTHRSRARSGRLHRHVRRPESPFGLPPACADHTRMVPRRHNVCSVGIRRIWDHALHNGRRSEITLSTEPPLKKAPISGAERVRCNGVFGISINHFGLPAASADHSLLEPRRHNGRSVGITLFWDQALLNGPRSGTTHMWNHALHNGLRSGTTQRTGLGCP